MKVSFNNKTKLKCDSMFCYSRDIKVLIKAKITVKKGDTTITGDTNKYCIDCFKTQVLYDLEKETT